MAPSRGLWWLLASVPGGCLGSDRAQSTGPGRQPCSMGGTQGSRLPLPPCAQGPAGRLPILLPLLVNSLFWKFPDSPSIPS